MDFRKLVSFLYDFLGPRVQPSLKGFPSSSYRGLKWEDLQKVKEDPPMSPHGSGSSSVELLEVEQCCVCLSRLKKGQDTRTLPCLHEFHKVCVDRWFDACRKTCPVCRFSIGGDDNFHIQEVLTDEMVIWFSSFHVAGF
ncbi:E3 ubiquitin-protein ligase RNF165-like [Juglans microcarpa x Juglans regia]|uniref:E3 ubiquitin-protein ligase RNF165-like n=1 Tax=Juglans microcarpa x Juglans regia TaxID=2249226 RepID=UPI001B7E9581|nr:E3 ubiquitin-protein ligase RNF165-like [Juglans microcarpa x Juglans regia]